MEHIFLIGLGQPMIDLINEVSEKILKEHSLEKNNAIRAQESHNSLFSEIKKDDNTKYVPGGSTTNTLRVASKILKRSNKNVGCIGKV
jgi:adenosine kinase